MKKIFLFILLGFSFSLQAQIFKTRYNNLYPYLKTLSFDVASIECLQFDQNFMQKELASLGFPRSRWLGAANMGLKVNYMHKSLFATTSCHWISHNENLHDSIKLKLGSFIYSLGIGTNLYLSEKWRFSPYVSYKFMRLKKGLALTSKDYDLIDYLKNRTLEFKVKQNVVSFGLDFYYVYHKQNHLSFHIGYLQPLHKKVKISTLSGSLNHTLSSPFRHLNFGFGYGFTISNL